jgi:protein-S-isoprenylcysteine O-methyltransferase Ste14
MPVVALLAYIAFVLVAFGWRTWLQYRRTGDAGFRGFRRGAREATASVLFIVGIFVAPLGPVAILRGWVEPVTALAHPVLHLVGLVAAGAGFALTVSAQLTMGASWRIGVDPGERTALVSEGVFAHVRNPIYTGLLLALVGMLLLAPSLLAVVALVTTLVGLELQVRGVEEPYLLRTHGEQYRSYVRHTGRFVPGIGRAG